MPVVNKRDVVIHGGKLKEVLEPVGLQKIGYALVIVEVDPTVKYVSKHHYINNVIQDGQMINWEVVAQFAKLDV